MESRSIKIKDYVTHERVPVRGDSHGNFTLSPLGFPFVNRSGYERGVTPPPRTFSADMLVKPELMEGEKSSSPFLEYKDKFDFPRTDSDHDTFIVTAKITADDNGYYISSEHANFYAGSYVTIEVDDATYEQLNRDFTVTGDNYIEIEPISLPDEGVSCKVTFCPEKTETSGEKPLFIKFTGSGENNGIYKLVVNEDENGILHYTWMYKTSIEEVACIHPTDIEYTKGDNDNVHDHYRNRVSDEEVAEYLRNRLGAAIECGKFRGVEYPVDAHGLLVKWFLSHGAIVHSVAGKTVVLDGFGHVVDTSGFGDCSVTPTPDEQGMDNIGVLNTWLMSTAGTNDYVDEPYDELSGDNNNIALDIKNSGERHTFVIQQKLKTMAQTPPRKTFIHLPTALDLADGTEVELNVALPVVEQPNTVGETTANVEEALKSFTDYVSQPIVYILSGKQNPLPNNAILNDDITTTANSFTFVPKHPIETDAETIAFGLYNRHECPNTFHFVGTVNAVDGIVTSITVDNPFPYNRSSRRWKMYSKDATCMVDVRTVDGETGQDGLTEHDTGSGAFDSTKTFYPESTECTDPKLLDEDSIVATIYPTSTNTFPWRLNGRNRVRHLGLTTNASVDYIKGGDKPLTRLVFEMNERVYSGLSGLSRGFRPRSELRYCEEDNDTAEGNSVLGSLLRVQLPETLDADVDDDNADNMYVVSRATKAFHDLIGDFKVARVGYVSTRDYDNKKNTSWGFEEDTPNPCPKPTISGTDNLQRLNDWETKIIHLPNYCLGVDENLERNLAYAGWNEYTRTDNFGIFYDETIDPFVDNNGYTPSGVDGANTYGNVNYLDSKDAAGTTQKTEENYSYTDDTAPFNYTVENSVFKLFLPNPTEQTRNQYATFIHGFLDLPIIKRGLRSISWLTDEASEFTNRNMEPFYPMSHVMSTDGIAFPDVSRGALRDIATMTEDTDVQRALLAIPDKVAIYNDMTIKAESLVTELISANIPDGDTDDDPVVGYMKSLLTMYSNGMPLHMYDAHRAINVENPDESDPYGKLLNLHEIGLYNGNGSLYYNNQHRYCDLATNSAMTYSEDVNLTYNLISDSGSDPQYAPVSLTTPLENVSSSFIANVFSGMYTRVHVKAMFSSALGRWIVKDYRQYPNCYLTPMYGAKTLDYTEKSYAYGNPKSYANRVPMSEGVKNNTFTAAKYVTACPEQPLWQLPCGVGSDYTDSMNKRYAEQAPMEMNPGCVPFLLESFPYDDDGNLNDTIKFRNLYESIFVPMDASGDPKEGSVTEVNFWNIKLHIRPARSAYPGADIPSNSARTGGTIGEAMLGMFNDNEVLPRRKMVLMESGQPLLLESNSPILLEG